LGVVDSHDASAVADAVTVLLCTGEISFAASRSRARRAASLANAGKATESQSATYKVKGFTCVTCAVGLEVMLRQQRGRHQGQRQLSRSKVTIGFDKNLTSEKALKGFIVSADFPWPDIRACCATHARGVNMEIQPIACEER